MNDLPINQILCGRNEFILSTFPADSIDLTVTSPPYDNLRTYKGFAWEFERTAAELYRVTKPGGVVVWVVADATINGSETGTSFRQALHFMTLGFNLHDTMIYASDKLPDTSKRYQPTFEYMFVFSKGTVKCFNPIMKTREQSTLDRAKYEIKGNRQIQKNGMYKASFTPANNNQETKRTNVWQYKSGNAANGDITDHTAPFPEKLAEDHILSWSNPGDVVLDPFIGSGTTAKMAIKHHRHFIGIDISEEYCDLIRRRIAAVQPTLFDLTAA